MPFKHVDQKPPDVDLKEVLLALKRMSCIVQTCSAATISRANPCHCANVWQVLECVTTDRFTQFTDLFDISEGRQVSW